MALITVTDTGTDYVTVKVSGMSSGVATINLYYRRITASKNNYVTSIGSSRFNKSGSTYYCTYTFDGLDAGTTYVFTVNFYSSSSSSPVDQESTEGATETATLPRPNDWRWSSTVRQGATIPYTKSGNTITCKPLTASEWNDFVDRIGEFAEYLFNGRTVNLSSLYVSSGTRMTADILNQARSVIDVLEPPTPVPSAISSGGKITAAYINGLMYALNSIE